MIPTEIQAKLEKKGLQKKFIAKQLGLTNVELSHYLHGTRTMPKEIKERLNKILN